MRVLCLCLSALPLTCGVVLFLESGLYSCVLQKVHPGQTVQGTVRSLGHFPLDLLVVDSEENSVLYRQSIETEPFSLPAHRRDTLSFCVLTQSPPPQDVKQRLSASLEIQLMKTVEQSTNDSAQALTELQPFEVMAKQIHDAAKDILHLYMATEEEDSRLAHTNELTVSNLYLCSFLCVFIATGLTLYQFFYLRRYFLAKNLLLLR